MLKEIKLRKGMSKDDVNELIGEWLRFENEEYLNAKYNHDWRCKCGNMFVRSWDSVRRQTHDCGCVAYDKSEKYYKEEVEKCGEYEYIRSFRIGDVLSDGKVAKRSPYIQVKHKYCGVTYEVSSGGFINVGRRCSHCCGSYENSFAYHIEKELGESLDKYWDFEKNTVNPYHISKSSSTKVWIRCQDVDYHESYEIRCYSFLGGKRCSYCHSKKLHSLDSFGQYLVDNNLYHLWSMKNIVDPFMISKSNSKKVWMLCDEKDYHNDYCGYEISCANFINGKRCSYCASKKVHPYDSFGYHNFDKVISWHTDNNISPFIVAKNDNKKYKFICETCENVWSTSLSNISRGGWCSRCKSSHGEKNIIEFFKYNNILFIHDEEYFKDLLSDKGNPLRPDFILPEHKIWIEYDGEFHYKDFYKDGRYELINYHDKLKDEYAKKHGWKMIRIPYWDFDNIETILEKELNL